jgi:hypothetical protein
MLKPVDKIFQPDPLVVSTCGRDGLSPLTAEEHHDWVAAIGLRPNVPEPVSVAFDRARNAFVYAWFSYDLGALAEAQALFTVELALRHRLGERAHEKDSIGNLIEKSIKDGVLAEHSSGPPRAFVFRMMRNEWAHGSVHIHTPAMTLDMLEACANLINEAFQSA